MMLVGVEPSFAGPDLRTFECPKCELAYKAGTGPNEIEDKAGWLQSIQRASIIPSLVTLFQQRLLMQNRSKQ
jgi:hypothetical protein